MNLLIVDDQIKVVEGLLHGVDWKKYGIDRAFGASSVSHALDIFDEHQIDVLLCDIEMPIESGLSLIRWVNKQDFTIRCILLTAHAKFDYAQESIQLRVFDYILQPAAYEQIALTVERAVNSLLAENEQQYLTDLGETFSRSESSILGGVLQHWLLRHGNETEYNRYAKLGKLPSEGQRCVCILVQILRWTVLDEWKPSLLEIAFQNIVQELFSASEATLLVTPMNRVNYAIVLWNGQEDLLQSALEQQLQLFVSVCQKYLGVVIATYATSLIAHNQVQEQYNRLEGLRDNNVSRNSAAFFLNANSLPKEEFAMNMPEIAFWTQRLVGNDPLVVEIEANRLLDEMSCAGKIDAVTLRIFYQDFLQAFHNALGANNEFWHETMSDPNVFKIYCDASNSVEQMKDFVHIAVAHFALRCAPPEQELLQKIDAYIDSHMQEEVSRQDVAGHVFLHPDYLNRILRKVTGCSLKEYISQRKLNYARTLLCTTHLPVALISTKIGHVNAAHFSVAYKKQFGVTPMQTRNEGKKEGKE